MAALSRPSLRSFTRQCPSLDDLPTTDTQQNLPSPRRAKRRRDASVSSSITSDQFCKKPKVYSRGFLRSKNVARTEVGNEISTPGNKVGNAVLKTSRKQEYGQLDFTDPVATIVCGQNPKVSNGHVSDRVGLSRKVDKRSLRSHDGGSRSKSELSLYFVNYDERVCTEAKDTEFISAKTPLVIIDDPLKHGTSSLTSSPPTKNAAPKRRFPTSPQSSMVNGFSPAAEVSIDNLHGLNDAQRIDFSSIERHTKHSVVDPLTDAFYFKAHRRAERQEKQLRNIEKERAQHEKVQLERILDGLKGHDWLRVMGISGITDSEKKAFEPKRNYFITEVSALIEKFRLWKEEEKRRKAERDLGDDDENASEPDSDFASDGDFLHDSDVDAWAERQLHQETISATSLPHRRRGRKPRAFLPALDLSLEKPFTSFYAKPYLRDAAIGKHRRGRTRFAFGQPLPEIPEMDFQLPPEVLSQEAIAAGARSRRRAKRESREM